MSSQELTYMSVAQQGRLIARRELSPVELVRAYLERIERWNPALNAYITVCAEHSVAQAVSLYIPEPDINDVVNRLSALLSAIEEIDQELGPQLETLDPVPPVFPREDF